ncbi:MAG: DUF2878 domain-containing protein [Granulosicoccus sp.]
MRKHYSVFANVVFYQLIWFGAVLGGQQYVVGLFALVLLHLYLSSGRREEMIVMGSCASIGIMTDSLLTYFGLFEFSHSPVVIPLWLVVLWLGFAGTFRLALSYFMKRPPLAIAAAVVGAPLSYLAAARLGAVTYPYGYLTTAAVLAAVWFILMNIFLRIVSSVESSAQKRIEGLS